MGDAAEGLIDADSRIQERLSELQQQKKTAKPVKDPERVRAVESCRLARTELERQLALTPHAVRRQQIQAAMAELDRRIAENTPVTG